MTPQKGDVVKCISDLYIFGENMKGKQFTIEYIAFGGFVLNNGVMVSPESFNHFFTIIKDLTGDEEEEVI